MDSSMAHAYFPAHSTIPNTFQPQQQSYTHTQTQRQTHLQPLPPVQSYAQTEIRPDEIPPSKRRRSDSLNPISPSTSKNNPTLNTPTHWPANLSGQSETHQRPISSFIPRDISPDRGSRVSAASSLPSNGPQLRKKPKSSSIKETDTLRVNTTVAPKTLSLSTHDLHIQAEHNSTTAPSNANEGSGISVSRANSSSSQHHSPALRRAPASHSSYGVETTCGPPPSYSTQRTFSQERIRKPDRNSQVWAQQNSAEPTNATGLDGTRDTSTQKRDGSNPLLNQEMPSHNAPSSRASIIHVGQMANTNGRSDGRMSSEEESGKISSSDERRSEDLFLNIAKVDAARQLQQKPEKKRSRLSVPFLPSSRSNNQFQVQNVPPKPEADGNTLSSQSYLTSSHRKQPSRGGQILGTASSRSRLDEDDQSREQPRNLVPDHGRSNSVGYLPASRGHGVPDTEAARLSHRSSVGLRNNKPTPDLPVLDQSRVGEHIATESTISTTAPSTVWDELDDLKSRIQKLEITGKIPSSSAAAMAFNERPRTATTAATTMSTSPKYRSSDQNLPSPVEYVPSNIHPLLHEALDNARNVLSHDVYQKLQAAAQDALQLASMMSTENEGNRNNSTIVINNDKQIKRRTESMCRGLTELAIVLASEARPLQSNIRPASRDYTLPPNSMLRSRRYSNDLANRDYVSGRVQSRLDSRRTSAHVVLNGHGYSSPEHGLYHTPAGASQVPDTRSNRSSGLLRKRGQGSFDGADEQYDASPSIRPGSRAMTDLGAYRHTSREPAQSSKDYGNHHPLPTPQQYVPVPNGSDTNLPANVNISFTSRRKHSSPVRTSTVHDGSPLTPREAWEKMSSVPVNTQPSDIRSDAGGLGRMGSSRHTIRFAGRVGSSVGSRLRAVRNEGDSREHLDPQNIRSMASSTHGNHIMPPSTSEAY